MPINVFIHLFLEGKGRGEGPKSKVEVLRKKTFLSVTGLCWLYTREKFNILLKPTLATLNSRLEIFANCRHKEAKLIGRLPG